MPDILHDIKVKSSVCDGLVVYELICSCWWNRFALSLDEVELTKAWHLNDSKSSVPLFETHLKDLEAGAWVYVALRHRTEFIAFMKERGHPTLLSLEVNKSVLRFHL